jgi:hypothetical protein
VLLTIYHLHFICQNLERKKYIRCLRIANHKDLVTLMPDRGSCSLIYVACCQQGVYRHVGAQLKLYANGTCKTTCPHEGGGYCVMLRRDWRKLVGHSFAMVGSLVLCCCYSEDFAKYHSCKEYIEHAQNGESFRHCQRYLTNLHQVSNTKLHLLFLYIYNQTRRRSRHSSLPHYYLAFPFACVSWEEINH